MSIYEKDETNIDCQDCGIECTFEVILAYGHSDHIDNYSCSSCRED